MGGSDVHSLAKRIADQITLYQRQQSIAVENFPFYSSACLFNFSQLPGKHLAVPARKIIDTWGRPQRVCSHGSCVSECSNLPMLLLLKSLIYSGVFVIVALFFFFPAKIEFIKKGSEYCVCVFVCDDTLLFSISSEATDDPFQEDSDSSMAWTTSSRIRRSDDLFFFPINE